MVQNAESAGADSVWLSEHHFFDDGYLPQPMTLAAAIASRTQRLRIGTAVLIAPLRSAVQIAEEAAIVDLVSGGRFELGLGAGYRVPEPIAADQSEATQAGERGFTRAIFGMLGIVFGAVLFIVVVGEWLGLFETLTERVPFPIGVALLPFQLALLEWHRKSELSTDRAGLLAVQDQLVAHRSFMKLAGGPDYGDTTSVDEFMRQAVAYETGGDAWDRILKLVNTAFREHPFNTVRAGELERWRTGGTYDLILAGTYTRRGEDGPGLKDDFADADLPILCGLGQYLLGAAVRVDSHRSHVDDREGHGREERAEHVEGIGRHVQRL
jgi:hypothetical protein